MAHEIKTVTYSGHVADNPNTFTYSGSFDVFKGIEVKVTLDNVALTYTSSTINESASPREYTVDTTAKTIHIGGGNLSSGTIQIKPETDLGQLTDTAPQAKADYSPGSSITSDDLNNNQLQLMRRALEYDEQKLDTAGGTMTGNLHMGVNADISFEGDTDNAYETTLTVTDPTADRTITFPNVTGTVVTTGDTGTVATGMIAADAITNAKIADDALDSEHYTDGSIDAAHLASSSVTTAKIASDAVTGAKIADDAIDSEHYTDGSIDTAHIADSQITTAKIAANNITTATIANNAITADKLAANSVDTSEITADAINGSKIADEAIDSEHYVDGSIDTAHIADANITTAKLATDAITTVKITDANVTTAKIADDAITIGKIGCEQTTISDSDSHVPTSGAVVDYVTAQITPIGGLEVIADKDSFPETQPASGVVISIADAQGIVVNGSGTSTTPDTITSDATVTINNINSSFNSSTVAAGIGWLVSSTGSGQIYNYHKANIKESDVVQLSDDINDFNSRYRVNAGEPGSNNDEGDLCYDTNADKMKVYDSSTSAWKEVTSTGDFKYLVMTNPGTTDAATLTNSTFDLKETSTSGSAASVTSAAQLLVSVNGVIQKANTGTSAPAEGFAISDADTIVFSSAPGAGASIFIIQFGSALTITTPGDGTVSTTKLAADAVTGAKIADNAIDSEHYTDGSIDHVHLANDAVDGDNIADDAVNSEHYVDGSIDTAHIADDQVTLAKMAGLARGKIIYGDSSGNPAALAIGTSGYTLVSDGTDISWGEAAAGAAGGGSDKVFWENGQTVTTNYTITNNMNAGSFGPITINSGVTVTVGSGENWTIV